MTMIIDVELFLAVYGWRKVGCYTDVPTWWTAVALLHSRQLLCGVTAQQQVGIQALGGAAV